MENVKVKELIQQLEHCNPDDEVRISHDYWDDKCRMRRALSAFDNDYPIALSTFDNVYPIANVIIQGDHPGNTIITHYED